MKGTSEATPSHTLVSGHPLVWKCDYEFVRTIIIIMGTKRFKVLIIHEMLKCMYILLVCSFCLLHIYMTVVNYLRPGIINATCKRVHWSVTYHFIVVSLVVAALCFMIVGHLYPHSD